MRLRAAVCYKRFSANLKGRRTWYVGRRKMHFLRPTYHVLRPDLDFHHFSWTYGAIHFIHPWDFDCPKHLSRWGRRDPNRKNTWSKRDWLNIRSAFRSPYALQNLLRLGRNKRRRNLRFNAWSLKRLRDNAFNGLKHECEDVGRGS